MASSFAGRFSSYFRNQQFADSLRFLAWTPVAAFFAQNVYSIATVSGGSMKPTFNPDASMLRKDVVLLNRWAVGLQELSRGDVVTLWSPSDPNLLITKRIVALEGDVVRTLPPHPDTYVRIPAGHAWVEGDEPMRSRDSNTFGPVPLGLVNSRVDRIVWPLWRFGPVPAFESAWRKRVFVRRGEHARLPPLDVHRHVETRAWEEEPEGQEGQEGQEEEEERPRWGDEAQAARGTRDAGEVD